MKINKFLSMACEKEKGKREVDIARASSFFKTINKMLMGIPYLMVRTGLFMGQKKMCKK